MKTEQEFSDSHLNGGALVAAGYCIAFDVVVACAVYVYFVGW